NAVVRRPQLSAGLLVDRGRPRNGDLPGGLRLQPAGRRAARRARPQGPAVGGPMTLLDIRNLRLAMRSYEGETEILHGIDLRIERGEIWGMVGETGSG